MPEQWDFLFFYSLFAVWSMWEKDIQLIILVVMYSFEVSMWGAYLVIYTLFFGLCKHVQDLPAECCRVVSLSQAFSSSITAFSSSVLLTVNSSLWLWEAAAWAWLSTDTWPLPERQRGRNKTPRVTRWGSEEWVSEVSQHFSLCLH